MSLDTLAPLSIVGAALGLSPVEIETTVQISADLSDSQIVLMHHVADIFTQGARVGLADSLVRVKPTPLDETDLLTLAGVAARLGIEEAQVPAMVKRGELFAPVHIPNIGARWYAPAVFPFAT